MYQADINVTETVYSSYFTHSAIRQQGQPYSRVNAL